MNGKIKKKKKKKKMIFPVNEIIAYVSRFYLKLGFDFLQELGWRWSGYQG